MYTNAPGTKLAGAACALLTQESNDAPSPAPGQPTHPPCPSLQPKQCRPSKLILGACIIDKHVQATHALAVPWGPECRSVQRGRRVGCMQAAAAIAALLLLLLLLLLALHMPLLPLLRVRQLLSGARPLLLLLLLLLLLVRWQGVCLSGQRRCAPWYSWPSRALH